MECGGNEPIIVFEDADLEQAINLGAAFIIGNTGQVLLLYLIIKYKLKFNLQFLFVSTTPHPPHPKHYPQTSTNNAASPQGQHDQVRLKLHPS